jgi:hypothetical protein
MSMCDERGEKAAFVMDVLNTLSGCCSGQQHFKPSFNKKMVESSRQDFATLLIDYIREDVTFGGNIDELFVSTFKLDSVQTFNSPEETKSAKRNLIAEFKDYATNTKLTNIMSHNEYALFRSLIIIVTVNYLMWYIIAFMKWASSTDEA